MGDIFQTETWQRLDPRLQTAFLAMAADAPGAVTLGSGWRSNEQQRRLHAQKPGLAAPPGSSNHEFGLAIDLNFENAATRRWVHANAARYGLWFPMDYEPWHIQLIGVDRHNVGGMGSRGGGRLAFSQPPDGRFGNPYDVLAATMEMEDNTDPGTQFGRLVAALSSPGQIAASPETGMESPVETGTASPETTMTGPLDLTTASVGQTNEEMP